MSMYDPVPEWWYLGPSVRRKDEQQPTMTTTTPVPVREIALERLKSWLDECLACNATPIALIAIGHDAQSGDLHVFRTEDGISDSDLGVLIAEVAVMLLHANG